jgi:hypothetical protein
LEGENYGNCMDFNVAYRGFSSKYNWICPLPYGLLGDEGEIKNLLGDGLAAPLFIATHFLEIKAVKCNE